MPTFPPVFAASTSPKARQKILSLATRWQEIGDLNQIPPIIYFGCVNPDRQLVAANYEVNEVIRSDRRFHADAPWWMIMLPTIDRITVGSHINFWASRKNRKYGNVVSVDPISQTIVVDLAGLGIETKTINISQVFSIIST